MKHPVVLCVSGVKNSGKTTLICSLIPILSEKGLRVAVIKHDGHSFTPDAPGTDSFRHFSAGACGTAVFDGEKFSVSRRARVSERDLIAFFPEADLILLEGFKQSDYPKIELIRQGVSVSPACDPSTHIAIVSDRSITADVPVFHPGEPERIGDFVNRYVVMRKEEAL